MPAISTVASPCVKVCQLDPRQVCTGCGRSLAEIAEWMDVGDERRRRIVEAARLRVAAMTQAQQEQQ